MSAGTKTMLMLFGVIFLSTGSTFVCGIFACCCFKPDDAIVVTQVAVAPAPVVAVAAPVAAAAPTDKPVEGVTPVGGYPGGTWGEQKTNAIEVSSPSVPPCHSLPSCHPLT
jgi:hypothetical protein